MLVLFALMAIHLDEAPVISAPDAGSATPFGRFGDATNPWLESGGRSNLLVA